MNVVNLTPHTINIFGAGLSGYEEIISLPSDGIARCSVESQKIGEIKQMNGEPSTLAYEDVGVKLYKTVFGDVEGLPDSEDDTIFIVSMLVRNALPNREDLYSPGELLRDDNGQPIECLGLTK